MVTFVALSNSSLNEFPKNNLTSFTNLISNDIKQDLKIFKKSYVQILLKGFYLNANFKLKHDEKPPNYVKIHFLQSNNQIINQQFDKCLARIPLNSANNYHETNTFYPVYANINELDKLSFKITDPYDKDIHLFPGNPTIIKLKIKKMNRQNNNSFTVTSNCELMHKMYDDNNKNDLTTALPHEFNLSKEIWEVALTKCILPPQLTDRTTGTIKIGSSEKHFEFGIYSSIYVLQKEIQMFFLSKVGHRVKIILSYPKSKGGMQFLITKETLKNELPKTIRPQDIVTIDKYMMYVLSGTFKNRAFALDMTTRIVFKKKPNINRITPKTLFLYSDLIKPNYVGNIRSSLMQIIPISIKNNNSDTHEIYTPKQLTFHDLNISRFHTVDFYLRTITGARFKTDTPIHKNFVITLLFRKKKRNKRK